VAPFSRTFSDRTGPPLYNPTVLQLRRTLRFCLNSPPPVSEAAAPASPTAPDSATPDPGPRTPDHPPQRHNNFAAFPAMRGLGRYYELVVACAGEADPQTGYFINIKRIDDAFAAEVLPYLEGIVAGGRAHAAAPLGETLRQIFNRLQPALRGSVQSVQLRLTPTYHLTLRSTAMDRVILRQSFEFSAAHRLHVPELSDARNVELFGKCNNPAGHGHNYRLEVAIRAPIDPAGQVLDVESLDALVDETVIQRLDHKNLDVDVPAFAGRNSSVENIAVVIYDWLGDAVGALNVELEEVSVWETGKTVCTYRGATPSATSSSP